MHGSNDRHNCSMIITARCRFGEFGEFSTALLGTEIAERFGAFPIGL